MVSTTYLYITIRGESNLSIGCWACKEKRFSTGGKGEFEPLFAVVLVVRCKWGVGALNLEELILGWPSISRFFVSSMPIYPNRTHYKYGGVSDG